MLLLLKTFTNLWIQICVCLYTDFTDLACLHNTYESSFTLVNNVLTTHDEIIQGVLNPGDHSKSILSYPVEHIHVKRKLRPGEIHMIQLSGAAHPIWAHWESNRGL